MSPTPAPDDAADDDDEDEEDDARRPVGTLELVWIMAKEEPVRMTTPCTGPISATASKDEGDRGGADEDEEGAKWAMRNRAGI